MSLQVTFEAEMFLSCCLDEVWVDGVGVFASLEGDALLQRQYKASAIKASCNDVLGVSVQSVGRRSQN